LRLRRLQGWAATLLRRQAEARASGEGAPPALALHPRIEAGLRHMARLELRGTAAPRLLPAPRVAAAEGADGAEGGAPGPGGELARAMWVEFDNKELEHYDEDGYPIGGSYYYEEDDSYDEDEDGLYDEDDSYDEDDDEPRSQLATKAARKSGPGTQAPRRQLATKAARKSGPGTQAPRRQLATKAARKQPAAKAARKGAPGMSLPARPRGRPWLTPTEAVTQKEAAGIFGEEWQWWGAGKVRDLLQFFDISIPREQRYVRAAHVLDSAACASLVTHLDALLAASPHGRDVLASSEGRVIDVIDPSLYCFVRNKSFLDHRAARAALGAKAAAQYQYCRRVEPADGDSSEDDYKIEHDWLPAEFEVAADGSVDICSYIPGLECSDANAALYNELGAAFSALLPLFELALAHAPPPHWQQSRFDFYQAPLLPAPPRRGAPAPLRGRRLQAIVKASYVELEPGDWHYGLWHAEGVRRERIVATGIHVLSASDSLSTGVMHFRRPLDDAELARLNAKHCRDNPPEWGSETPSRVFVGSVETPAGSSLVFANHLQRRLGELFCDANARARGVRKALCFFLVDPEQPALSTAHVPWQDWDAVAAAASAACRAACPALPDDALARLLARARWGLTREEALKARTALTNDRQSTKDQLKWGNTFMLREYDRYTSSRRD
jgi:hypothetical protein